MDTAYDDFFTDEMIDQCEQVRSVAKKSWLSSASVSLAHLDNVKARVYNVGLVDPRDLKATNLASKKPPELTSKPPVASLTDRNSTAWGSNTSIPDLLRQQGISTSTLPKPTRPVSAKTRWTRPPSGKRNRPQSAKEPIQVPYSVSEIEVDPRQGFGVKGAKYDVNGRPPKGISHTSSVGWVGPPAGLKYPDKPSNGSSWTIDFPMDGEEQEEGSVSGEAGPDDMPRPPHTTPVPPTPEPEEKTKRIFELYIGDPYKEDDFIQSDSEEEEFGPSYTTSKVTSSAPSNNNSIPLDNSHKGSLRLDLPTTEDDYDDIDEVDTERLLAEAEAVTQNLDLKGIINANKHIPQSTASHVINTNDKTTNQNRTNSHETIEYNKAKSPNKTASCSQTELSATSKDKARHLVSQMIDENGLEFSRPDTDSSKHKSEIRPLSSVKFSEDVRTVPITPRNMGRKVEEMHHGKKKHIPHHADSGFVDLIEMKNRIEPVLSTSKAEMSAPDRVGPPSGSVGSRSNSSSRPPSGAMRPSTRSTNSTKPQTNDRPRVPTSNHTTSDLALNLNRPRSAPLNRATKPITMVTVDYGEAETQDKKEKLKRKKKGSDDIETVMEAMNRKLKSEEEKAPTSNNTNTRDSAENVNTNNANNNELSTVFKSEPVKNYYEISRHSSLSNHSTVEESATVLDVNKPMTSVPVIKTTKTLEFDEIKPKEVTIKSVLDQQTLSTKDKDQFVSSLHLKEEGRSRSRLLASNSKPPVLKPPTEDNERPGSRRGYLPLTPTKSLRQKIQQNVKKASRPSSAPVQKRSLNTDNMAADKLDKENKDKPLTKEEREERDKVIDNLLQRTKTLLNDCDKKLESDNTELLVTKSVRPSSAHVGPGARGKDQRRVKSATVKRPLSTTTTKHKHYASYSQGSASVKPRKSTGKTKPKVILTEPCIINTNTPYFEEETEEDIACKDLQKTLADKGVTITAETLQRALYPPTGKSKHYQITADLPKRTSISLLSHPKVWLPQEYRNLQQAEKTLSRANEIMFLQKRAEVRRAKLEAMGPEERKKMKKKGKKGNKKLRKSQTLG